MGYIVKLSKIPQVMKSTSYDADVVALNMGEDEAYKVDIPKERKARNIALALSQHIKARGHKDQLHVTRTKDEIYILHGPMRTVNSKNKQGNS